MTEQCTHERVEVRRRVQSNGGVAYWRQCLDCYQTVGTAIKHADAPADAPPFDEEAREDHWKLLSTAGFEALRRSNDERRRDRQREYYDYLQTEKWHIKREAVLDRDNYICQAQLNGCTMRASQAHHKTYEHIFDEPLFDLVAVCRACHQRLHRFDE